MYQSLGLDPKSTILLQCHDEFTHDEMEQYLKNISIKTPIPEWLPKRPLIFKIVSEFNAEEIQYLLNDGLGEVEFWKRFIDAVCDRESKINRILDGASIKYILQQVASLSRTKVSDLGPITISELNKAFEIVVGSPPTDESAIVLQRLPTIKRVQSDSADRQFVDSYILDGLRAEDLIYRAITQSEETLSFIWTNPLRRFGITVIADYIQTTSDQTSMVAYMHRAAASTNAVLACDILASLCVTSNEIDFHHLSINSGIISYLDFSDSAISNLTISSTVIETLDITNIQPHNLIIQDCIISEIIGLTGPSGVPDWMKNNAIEKYQSISTVSQIRSIKELPKHQQIFLTIVKKTFFQPGSGRKEEALLRGWGAQADNKIAKKIINKLIDEDVLKRIKGQEGWVYLPNREFTNRMIEITEKLGSSEDPLWKSIDALG